MPMELGCMKGWVALVGWLMSWPTVEATLRKLVMSLVESFEDILTCWGRETAGPVVVGYGHERGRLRLKS